jgi:hypothetical protein
VTSGVGVNQDDHHQVLDGPQYRSLLASLDRVVALAPEDSGNVSPTMLTRIKAHVDRLRRVVVPRLDSELGISCPLITVDPYFWFRQMGDGSEGLSRAHVGPHQTGRWWVYAIQLPASTLMLFEPVIIDGILAHEFVRYVWETMTLYQRSVVNGATDVQSADPRFYSTPEEYEQLDRQRRAPPEAWLSPRLLKLLKRVENRNDPAMSKARRLSCAFRPS